MIFTVVSHWYLYPSMPGDYQVMQDGFVCGVVVYLDPAGIDREGWSAWSRWLYGISSIRSTLVEPGVPIGTPAVITILSPDWANPWVTAVSLALFTTAEKRSSLAICTAWTPQAMAIRRAVRSLEVTQSIGTLGRSRDARSVVEPEVV
jgi:hypothetical protein